MVRGGADYSALIDDFTARFFSTESGLELAKSGLQDTMQRFASRTSDPGSHSWG
jgi:hypothetical protein